MRYLSITCALVAASSLFGNPKDGTIISGTATIQSSGKSTTIKQTSSNAIIDWDSFSISAGELVTFTQPSSTASILNRVTGKTASKLLGNLVGNGSVYLINSNGVVVGPNGIVQTAGDFVASSLDVANDSYLAGGELMFSGASTQNVVNKGKILTSNGNVFLISQQVKNEGTLTALQGEVGLAAGSEILLQPSGEQRIFVVLSKGSQVLNSGTISAVTSELKAAGENVYSFAIKQSGTINAGGIQHANGKIFLCAATADVDVSGTMQAPLGVIQVLGDNLTIRKTALIDTSNKMGGGTILIGGDQNGLSSSLQRAKQVEVEAGSLIKANATFSGNGGTVVLWGDNKTVFNGNISAQGGSVSGNGGFVEVSSPLNLKFNGKVSTIAPKGTTGTLSLDPSDIYIGDFGGFTLPAFPTTPPATYDPTGSFGILDITVLLGALATNNVSVSSHSGTGGTGTVTVMSDVIWDTPTTLQLISDNAMWLEGVTIQNTYVSSGVTSAWTAMDFQSNQITPMTGNFDGINLIGSSLLSAEGDINLLATGGTDDSDMGIYCDTSVVQSTATAATYAGGITMNGSTGSGTGNFLTGVGLDDASTISSVDGNINLTGVSNGTGIQPQGFFTHTNSVIQATGDGAITISGTGGPSGEFGYGVIVQTTAITTVNGAISVTGTAISDGINSEGIYMDSTSQVSSTGPIASITLNGTGGMGTDQCQGLLLANSLIQSGDAPITIIGQSGGTGDHNSGMYLGASLQIISNVGLTLTGTPGAGIDSYGVRGDSSQIFTPSTMITGSIGID